MDENVDRVKNNSRKYQSHSKTYFELENISISLQSVQLSTSSIVNWIQAFNHFRSHEYIRQMRLNILENPFLPLNPKPLLHIFAGVCLCEQEKHTHNGHRHNRWEKTHLCWKNTCGTAPVWGKVWKGRMATQWRFPYGECVHGINVCVCVSVFVDFFAMRMCFGLPMVRRKGSPRFPGKRRDAVSVCLASSVLTHSDGHGPSAGLPVRRWVNTQFLISSERRLSVVSVRAIDAHILSDGQPEWQQNLSARWCVAFFSRTIPTPPPPSSSSSTASVASVDSRRWETVLIDCRWRSETDRLRYRLWIVASLFGRVECTVFVGECTRYGPSRRWAIYL